MARFRKNIWVILGIWFLGQGLTPDLSKAGKSITAEEEFSSSQNSVKTFVEKGDQNFEEGNFEKALKYYNKAFNTLSFEKDKAQYLKIGNKKLHLLIENAGISAYHPFAEKLLEKSHVIKYQNPALHVRTLRLVAQTYLANKKDLSKAKKLLTEGVNFHKNNVDGHYEKLAFLNSYLGLLEHFENDFKACRSYLKKAERLIQRHNLKDIHLKAVSYRYKGHYYQKIKELDSCLKFYKASFNLVKKNNPPGHPFLAKYYSDLLGIYRMLGQEDSAFHYGKKALSNLKKNNLVNSRNGALAYLRLGTLSYSRRNLEKALLYHNKSLEIYQSLKNTRPHNLLNVYHGLGVVTQKLGYQEKSRKYLQKGLNLDLPREDRTITFAKAPIYYNLGRNLLAKNSHEKAIDHFNKAINIYEVKLPNKNPYLHTIKIFLAKSYVLNGAFAKARTLIAQEKNYYSKRRNKPTFKRLYYLLRDLETLLLRKEGRYDSALRIHQKLIKDNSVNFNPQNLRQNPPLNKLINIKYFRSNVLNAKAKTLYLKYKRTNGLKYLKSAYQTYSLIDSIQKRYNQKIKLKREKAFYKRIFKDQSATGFKIIFELIQRTPSVKSRRKYLKKAFYFAESDKAALLMQSLSEKALQDSKGLPDSFLNKLKKCQSRLKKVQNNIYQTRDTLKQYNLQEKKLRIKKQQRELYAQVKVNFPKVYRKNLHSSAIKLNKLQKSLEAHNKNLIEYYYYDSLLFGMVITPEDIFLRKLPNPDDSLSAYIEKIRKGFNEQGDFASHTAHQLYKILFQKLAKDLNKTEVVIIPHGKMGYIPFEVLLQSHKPKSNLKDKPYLIKQYAFSYSPSATLWNTLRDRAKQRAKNQYIGFTPQFRNKKPLKKDPLLSEKNADSEAHLKSLPYSNLEIKKAKDYWNGKSFFGENATESLFKQKAPNSKVIHLATHGLIDDRNPAYNRLYFAPDSTSPEDGILHTYEVYDLNLRTELAVLSACNTGYGKIYEGSGIMSLAKGFKIAGCENILMTLWSVNDRAGATLVEDFYENLQMGFKKSKALRRAKLNYLKNNDPTNANPYFWGGFVLMGSKKAVEKPDFSYNWIFFSVSGTLLLILFIGIITLRNRKKAGA